jgi:hypothetical protein
VRLLPPEVVVVAGRGQFVGQLVQGVRSYLRNAVVRAEVVLHDPLGVAFCVGVGVGQVQVVLGVVENLRRREISFWSMVFECGWPHRVAIFNTSEQSGAFNHELMLIPRD